MNMKELEDAARFPVHLTSFFYIYSFMPGTVLGSATVLGAAT